MTNTLVFTDMASDDPTATAKFYEELFGWEIEGRPEGEFHRIVPGQGLHLGIYSRDLQPPGPSPRRGQDRLGPDDAVSLPSGARIYILVDQPAQVYLDRATELGATPLWNEEYWAEFDGHHASFLDPWGNQLVLWWKPDFDDAVERERLGLKD